MALVPRTRAEYTLKFLGGSSVALPTKPVAIDGVYVDVVDASGPLSAHDVGAVVRGRIQSFRPCYAGHTMQPGMIAEGIVGASLAWRIEPNGKVSSVSIVRSAGSTRVDDCLEAQAKKLSFPKRREATDITVRIEPSAAKPERESPTPR